MKRFGSQIRETLKESGYKLVGRLSKGMVILEDENGKQEIWGANDDHAGYTIQVGRWGYEFCSSLKEYIQDFQSQNRNTPERRRLAKKRRVEYVGTKVEPWVWQ